MQLGSATLGVSVTMAVFGSLGVIVGSSCHMPRAGCCTPAKGALLNTSSAGTTLNWQLDGRLNRAEWLFPGVGCFLVAVVLGLCTNAADVHDRARRARKGELPAADGPLAASLILSCCADRQTEDLFEMPLIPGPFSSPVPGLTGASSAVLYSEVGCALPAQLLPLLCMQADR